MNAKEWKNNIKINLEKQNVLIIVEKNKLKELDIEKQEKKKEINIIDSEILKNSKYIKKNIELYAKNTLSLLTDINDINDFDSMFTIYKQMNDNALNFFSKKEFVKEKQNISWLKLYLPLWSLEKYHISMVEKKKSKIKEYKLCEEKYNSVKNNVMEIENEITKLQQEFKEINIFSRKISNIRNKKNN